MKNIPLITVPIIDKRNTTNVNLYEFLKNKNVVIFGVPGAYTPTCSEQHLPGFLKLSEKIKDKNIDDIFCLSVNDQYVMQAWLLSYQHNDRIKGIADGNAEIVKALDLISDKSLNFMGLRCVRFAMIVCNSSIKNLLVEKPGNFEVSSAENILSIL